jgi:hypothetical protein
VEAAMTPAAVPVTAPPERHVFISHADEDRATSMEIVGALEGDAVQCWIAHRDIPPGSSWMGAIVDAIVASRLMVVVVSKHSLVSENVLREVTIAADERVPFVPFCIDESPLSKDFRFFFSTAQRLDAHRHPREAAMSLLQASVAARLKVAR